MSHLFCVFAPAVRKRRKLLQKCSFWFPSAMMKCICSSGLTRRNRFELMIAGRALVLHCCWRQFMTLFTVNRLEYFDLIAILKFIFESMILILIRRGSFFWFIINSFIWFYYKTYNVNILETAVCTISCPFIFRCNQFHGQIINNNKAYM